MILLFRHFVIPLFCYSIIPFLFLSCAKEIYTDEDAANAKREAQKVGLTVMIRDVGSRAADLSGFTVSSSQCGEVVQAVTSTDGIANVIVFKGDVVLLVQKEGYVSATAVVTTRPTEKERNNTVVVIPMLSDHQTTGTIQGKVFMEIQPSVEKSLSDALVSIDLDMNEWIRIAFQGMGTISENYQPGALAYSSVHLLQPVLTDASGAFRLAVPVTAAEMTYTVSVHETAFTSNSYCSAKQTVVTNGQNTPALHFHLTPYEK